MHKYNNVEHYKNNCIISHAQNTTALQPIIFQIVHVDYWLHIRDGRPCEAQITEGHYPLQAW